MQPNSITQAIDETVHQVQAEQDKLYHCLYACVKLSPSSQETNSAHLCTSQSFKSKGRPGPPSLMTSFPNITTHTEEKKSTQNGRRVSQDSVPSVRADHSNHPPHQPVPGQAIFPLPKLPVSYATPISPRLPVPFITAHKTCVLPVISGCKREAKLQVGTCSVSSNWRGKR